LPTQKANSFPSWGSSSSGGRRRDLDKSEKSEGRGPEESRKYSVSSVKKDLIRGR